MRMKGKIMFTDWLQIASNNIILPSGMEVLYLYKAKNLEPYTNTIIRTLHSDTGTHKSTGYQLSMFD